LLSLLLSFLNYRQFLAGPGYLVIGLAVCFSRFNPDARVTVMGFTAPIVWVPWILAIVSVLIDPSMLFSGVVGLVTGFLAAKIAKLGTAEEAEWRHKGGYYAYVKGEKPRPRQYGFSGKGRKLAD
jgi:hypothetical protein